MDDRLLVSRGHSQHAAGGPIGRPGMVRISLGAYNTAEEIDTAVEMLRRIARHDYQGRYSTIAETGEYTPSVYPDPTLSRRAAIV